MVNQYGTLTSENARILISERSPNNVTISKRLINVAYGQVKTRDSFIMILNFCRWWINISMAKVIMVMVSS